MDREKAWEKVLEMLGRGAEALFSCHGKQLLLLYLRFIPTLPLYCHVFYLEICCYRGS
jgi:hypothetical protein